MLRERKDEKTARCPFCHDGLEAARLVECDACRAVYHAECVERCVVLACQGTLVGAELASPAPRGVLRIDLAPAEQLPPAARPPTRLAALCRAGFLVSLAGFVGLLAAGALTDARVLLSPAFGCLVACVLFAQGETSPARERRREERAHGRAVARPTTLPPVAPPPAAPLSAGPPLPAPAPVAFPAMFGAPPVAAGEATVEDEARRRISARREARRPGGLGKTL